MMNNDEKMAYVDQLNAVTAVPAPSAASDTRNNNDNSLFANEYNQDVFTIDANDDMMTKTENGMYNTNKNTATPAGGPTVSGVVVGSGAAVAPIDGIHRGERRGHSCCGCCCDMRRAVIIVNIINIILAFIGLIGFSVLVADTNNSEVVSDGENSTTFVGIDDDYTLGEYEIVKGFAPLVIILVLLSIVGFALGIVGAMRYKVWMILVAIVVYCISAFMELLSLNLVGFAVTALYAYPHFVLVSEIRRGIMTKETYHMEQQSCCCV